MLTVAFLAAAVIAGAHPAALLVVAAAVYQPEGFLALTAAWAVYHARQRALRRRVAPSDEARFLQGVAAEISGGAGLQAALMSAAHGTPELQLDTVVRYAAAGRPAPEIARALRAALPLNGRMAAASYALIAETGARAAPMFSGLALRAATAGEVAREQRVVTAQARLSAWLIGGTPAVGTAGLLAVGRGPGEGIGASVALIGVGLIVAGLALVVWLVRES